MTEVFGIALTIAIMAGIAWLCFVFVGFVVYVAVGEPELLFCAVLSPVWLPIAIAKRLKRRLRTAPHDLINLGERSRKIIRDAWRRDV